MIASFHGYVEIVGMLIKANVHVNTQNEVCYSYYQKHCTMHLTTIVVLGELSVCFHPTERLYCSSPGSSERKS